LVDLSGYSCFFHH